MGRGDIAKVKFRDRSTWDRKKEPSIMFVGGTLSAIDCPAFTKLRIKFLS
jgi:hypothetical protein